MPASLRVVEHVRWKYACRGCQEHVAIAPPAAKPIERGIPGPGLLAQLIVSKYGDHLPLYRLEDVFARHGVDLSRSTLCRWARMAADLFAPLYELMAQRVRRSHVIHTDDTTVPVFDPELPQTRTGRFWVYIGDAEHPYSVYDYTPTHQREGPAEFLAGYSGYLAADAFSGYDGIYAGGTVKQVLCWAHARRKFYEARTAQPAAHQALAFIGRLYDIEREAKDLLPERRLKLRRARSLPILEQLRAHLAATEPAKLPEFRWLRRSATCCRVGTALRATAKMADWRSTTTSRNAPYGRARSAARTGYSWAATGAGERRPLSSAWWPARSGTRWNRLLTCATCYRASARLPLRCPSSCRTPGSPAIPLRIAAHPADGPPAVRFVRRLPNINLGSAVWSPPTAANGVLFVASQRNLWAVKESRGSCPRAASG